MDNESEWEGVTDIGKALGTCYINAQLIQLITFVMASAIPFATVCTSAKFGVG